MLLLKINSNAVVMRTPKTKTAVPKMRSPVPLYTAKKTRTGMNEMIFKLVSFMGRNYTSKEMDDQGSCTEFETLR